MTPNVVRASVLALSVLGASCDAPWGETASPPRERTSTVAATRTPTPPAGATPPTLALPYARAAYATEPDVDALAVREPTEWRADLRWRGAARVAHAKRAKQGEVTKLFAAAGVAFPARDLLFRVYKQEGVVEVWAGGGEGPLAQVATYRICAASGELGPKRAEGDLQVPEGFYTFSFFHPESAYYLAALIDYPNRSDKIRGSKTPGGQILMHGSCASIGCIAMTDERIEELYLMAWSTWRERGARTHVHILPGRDLDRLLADPGYADHHAFWRELREEQRAWERTRRIPTIDVASDGRYLVSAAR